MLGNRPHDTRLRFGLALEYLRVGRTDDGIRELRRYLDEADDEGNAWGRLAGALAETGRHPEARRALERGIEAARRHGHPTMAEEFEQMLQELGD